MSHTVFYDIKAWISTRYFTFIRDYPCVAYKRNVTNPDVEGGDGFAVSGVTGWFTDFRTIICRGYFLLYFFGLIRSGGRQVTRRHGGFSSVREADVGICRVHFEHKADLLSRSHAGIDLPEVDRRGKASNRSWGVAFVEVHSNERTACRASGRTAGHCSVGSPCDFKANSIVFHTMPV
ncbi:hypothetical protein T11_16941 [Trichinella zimbabwensis]|uniref:Uncharacterized protein n=1 Tax=Trichinella zimbabwensis TaxID=268475 RepID=A0A0V1H248_9BILA|nr:hypothetical protein T11_16941 [Trichinella zimbabwensis]